MKTVSFIVCHFHTLKIGSLQSPVCDWIPMLSIHGLLVSVVGAFIYQVDMTLYNMKLWIPDNVSIHLDFNITLYTKYEHSLDIIKDWAILTYTYIQILNSVEYIQTWL